MTTITITDRASVQARDVTPEGYLRVRARIARTGIQVYRSWEMGMALQVHSAQSPAQSPTRQVGPHRALSTIAM